jgi:GNAT superfamily N-acetyltransferase
MSRLGCAELVSGIGDLGWVTSGRVTFRVTCQCSVARGPAARPGVPRRTHGWWGSDGGQRVAKKKRVRVLPATADRLVTGWAGPGGSRVRLARPGDTDQVTRLLALADISLDPAVGAVIKAGTVASTLLLGLDHGTNDMLRPLVEAAAAGNPDDAMPGLVLALVAEGRDGSLGGVLQAVPPTNVLADGVEGGVPVLNAVLGAAKVAKIRALAVAEDARGMGIGATLIRRTVGIYRQLGYCLVYGQFPTGSGLENYYSRQGFTVLDEGQHIDLSRLGLPIHIRTDPSEPERLFVRWH